MNDRPCRVAGAARSLAAARPGAAAPRRSTAQWRGTSDGGSCNAPLDYVLTIEDGFVDGSAYRHDRARPGAQHQARGRRRAPTPGLWQIHGLARPSGDFPLSSVASVKGTDRREGKLTARSEGGALVVTETGGCRRTARLSRG